MWKYVSRRLKETFERSCNVLDVHKTWICSVQKVATTKPDSDDTLCLVVCKQLDFANNPRHKEHHRKRVGDWSYITGAITWSGAIICGWYASQLLCLHRRHLGGWDHHRHSHCFLGKRRGSHTNAFSNYVRASPVYPPLLAAQPIQDQLRTFGANDDSVRKDETILLDVNNDYSIKEKLQQDESNSKQHVDEAVADLVTFLGETEYKMGVKSIAQKDYRAAVAHLKLATSHNHPGGTFNLGLCYEKGLGVRKNLKRAMECYQVASSMGHSKAMYNLGVFYAHGLGGLEKDYEAAEKCFVTAAHLGQPEAINALGGIKTSKHEPPPPPPFTKLLFGEDKAKLYATAAKFT